MRNVFVAETVTDAAIVRNLLVQHGIDCQLVEKVLSRYAAGNTEVWIIDDRQETEARRLIREVFSGPVRDEEWRCQKCTESNPGTFESCWACSAHRRA
jgi:hypothetical protein